MTVETQTRTRSRISLFGVLPLFSWTEDVQRPKAQASAMQQSGTQRLIEGSSLAQEEQRDREIERRAAVRVDENAAIGRAISEQHVVASRDRVTTQMNYMRVEVNAGLEEHLTGFVIACQVRRATAMMTDMQGAGFGSLAEALQEFQRVTSRGEASRETTPCPALNAGGTTQRRDTAVDTHPPTEEPEEEEDGDDQEAAARLEQEMEETRRRLG